MAHPEQFRPEAGEEDAEYNASLKTFDPAAFARKVRERKDKEEALMPGAFFQQ